LPEQIQIERKLKLVICFAMDLRHHSPIITASTYPFIDIGTGNDEPGMILQCRDVERGYIVWRDHTVDGETVKLPVDIDALPPGQHRLV
jgi:hypothetical protein